MRGHLNEGAGATTAEGTIPAGAGTPPGFRRRTGCTWDYPRGCGDTRFSRRLSRPTLGLSPRVRGHLRRKTHDADRHGTIPAGAGTPAGSSARVPMRRDYPRGCGDTQSAPGGKFEKMGLSPRVRGHRKLRYEKREQNGTIPAGAGTPFECGPDSTQSEDYPRGCGDTNLQIALVYGNQGLSPRVRGHRLGGEILFPPEGTIPAGAGTPTSAIALDTSFRDYPRGCGDTRVGCQVRRVASGLSPRVRGHQPHTTYQDEPYGTIPAGAGTPLCHYGITAAKKGQLRID